MYFLYGALIEAANAIEISSTRNQSFDDGDWDVTNAETILGAAVANWACKTLASFQNVHAARYMAELNTPDMILNFVSELANTAVSGATSFA